MKRKIQFIITILMGLGFLGLILFPAKAEKAEKMIELFNVNKQAYDKVTISSKSNKEWKKELSPDVYHILREKGTERPFSYDGLNVKKMGVYKCAGCGTDLFYSKHKFDSGTGWPSFWRPVAKENIVEKEDNSLFMKRTEVLCPRCQGHLGHVFPDGPAPSHLRYCINGRALKFVADETQ